jgi:hypothetical protein
MSGKRKWFGLAALIAVIVALIKREKRSEDDTSGTMET